MGNYRLRPEVELHGVEAGAQGWPHLVRTLAKRLARHASEKGPKLVLVLECYPGTDLGELRNRLIDPLRPSCVLCADEYAWESARVQERIADTITNDRVFGKMSHYTLADFFDGESLDSARAKLAASTGLSVVYGTGAALIASRPDVLAYADLPRWEIQLRYRAGMPNWKTENAHEDALRKFKRGYFF